MKQVYIRCDASHTIGGGHVMRMLSLAQAFQSLDVRVSFICYPLPHHLAETVRVLGFPLITVTYTPLKPDGELDWQTELACLERLADPEADLIVDHYNYTLEMLEGAAPLFRRLILFEDDKPERVTPKAAVLINHNFSADTIPYKPFEGQVHLLGPKYALLRKEIAAAAAHPYDVQDTCRRILICFGFSDATLATPGVLAALNQIDAPLAITVLIKPESPNYQRVKELANDSPHQVDLLTHSDDMAALMRAQDALIVSASTVSLEALALGLPTAVVSCVPNQYPGAVAMDRQGVVCYLGKANSLKKDAVKQPPLAELIHDVNERRRLSKAGASSVNPNGSVLLAKYLSGFEP